MEKKDGVAAAVAANTDNFAGACVANAGGTIGGGFDDAIEELSNIKNIGGDAGQQIATTTIPAKTQKKSTKAKSAKKNKS